MLKIIGIIITLILADFYFFPFEPAFLPSINVKMMLAVVSLPYIGYLLAKKGNANINKDLLVIFLYTVPITVFSWLSNVYNDTSDYSFNTYFVSVFVWMGAAFIVTSFMKAVHKKLSVQLVVKYLIAVCVLQCLLALGMEYSPALKIFVKGLMAESGSAFMGDAGNRMFGLGCALDVAGGRFAAILVMIAYLLSKAEEKRDTYFYIFSFLIIAVIGNMIGRTTTIGILLSFAYWTYDLFDGGWKKTYMRHLIGTFVIVIPLVVCLCFVDNTFYSNIRFGFEGFFSLVEEGEFKTNSSDILIDYMIVFPDNVKTWLIGDGYGANPDFDPYYIGKSYHGFYKGTDIGYLRFIFFFGLLGMFSMIALFFCFWRICCNRFQNLKGLVTLILILNLVVWVKATSDLLPVFAILLCISKDDQDTYEIDISHPFPL